MSGRYRAAMGALITLVCGGACGSSSNPGLTKSELEDPAQCKTCHPQHYAEWAGSMHAYAAEDPVFRAMIQRAQQDNPATAAFCLKCHAPLAVRDNLTTDGSNLDALPASKRGVTCYFCHAANAIAPGELHNNPLVLATDDSLYGPFGDPAPETPHKGLYSAMFDGATVQSANTCGSCHDIQNLQGAHVERTFREWQTTIFTVTPGGSSCAQCHMAGRDGAASTVSSKVRRLHSHAFPAVDLAVTPFPADDPQNDAQRKSAQAFLDTVVQSTLCFNPGTSRFELTLDNAPGGHAFPSGATPDRRVWVDVTAYVGDEVVYSSGGAAALPLENSPDPDLWLMRDCLYDDAGKEVSMFWQPTTLVGNALPGNVVQTVSDPCSFNVTHVKKLYPDPPTPALAQIPDRVTVQIHLQAIGDDVLNELVQGGFLDASVPSAIARYDLGGGAPLEWTKATAGAVVDPTQSGTVLSCVSNGTWRSNTVPAQSHAKCTPTPPACKEPGT